MGSNDRALLERYLTATRHAWRPVSGSVAHAAAEIGARGFPTVDLGCVFVPIRSRTRRCEYRVVGNTGFVVVDLELSDRLMELDLLVQIGAMHPDWVYGFFVVFLADVFRQQRDLVRYRYCVLKASGDISSLARLASLPKDGPPIHAAIAPVVLHELAHVVFRRAEPFVGPLRGFAHAALARFADAAAAQAATGHPPVEAATTLGVPFEQYDQDRLRRQLELYAATIRNNAELEEEVTCDVIAALALITFESGIECFDVVAARHMPLSIRQFGDLLYLAIKTSRYLQLLTGLRQFGANVTVGSDALERGVIEMTARTSALTHVLLAIFRAQLDVSTFEAMPDFGRALSADEAGAVLHRSIAQLMRHQHERLLGPFEDLTAFFVTQDVFDADNGALLGRGAAPVSFEAVDAVRETLPF